MVDQELESRLQKQVQDTQALTLRIESLNRQVLDLMDELQIQPEKLRSFLEEPAHFTKENWEDLQRLHQELNQKLQREIGNVRNPQEMRKKQAERNIPPHWLFVR